MLLRSKCRSPVLVTVRKNSTNNGEIHQYLTSYKLRFSMELMYVWDNTVGSSIRVNPTVLAYIAGFLDGDGCIKVTIAKRDYAKFGYYFRVIVSFAQHIRDRRVLVWIKSKLKVGSISDYDLPGKQVSEYVIQDRKFNFRLLFNLRPFVVVKKRQLELASEILSLKDKVKNPISFKRAMKAAMEIRRLNSPSKFDSSPVTTHMGGTG